MPLPWHKDKTTSAMKPHQKPFVMKTEWWAVFPVTITVGGEHLHWNDFSKTFQANCSQAKNEKMHSLNWNSSAALAQNHPSISLFCYLVKQKADFNGVFKCFLKITLERHLLQYFSHSSTPKPEKNQEPWDKIPSQNRICDLKISVDVF